MRRTAASRAALAELAYPLTAAVAGVAFLDARLQPGLWVGAALVISAVTALSLHESRAKTPSVQLAPDQLAPGDAVDPPAIPASR